MNIFILSYIPFLCAKMHSDLHLIKMILETTQLLSTCYRFLNGERPKLKSKKLLEKMNNDNPVLYYDNKWILKCEKECNKKPLKMTHYNHGCSIWLRQRINNFIWLCKLGLELCKEKKLRLPNKNPHCCEKLILWYLKNPPNTNLFKEKNKYKISVPYLAISGFWDCKIKNSDPYKEVLLSYRKYYKAKETINIVYYKWKPERKPKWLIEHEEIPKEKIKLIKQKLNK